MDPTFQKGKAQSCVYCNAYMGKHKKTRDHFMPRKKGGCECSHNKLPCCKKCNRAKGHMHPLHWLQRFTLEKRKQFEAVCRKLVACPENSLREGYVLD